ncbi:hypothetical protein [Roseovarius ramblicola]|uniref:Lipoprotein n=1 Tax=Roseovarius ramblicola TaxID=2022336 RepID=A0ABV5I1W1_9RHOB
MRSVALLLMAVLAACSHPSPAFYGVAPVRVGVGQSMFDVRIVGRHAQAIRLSREWAPRTIMVAPRAAAAIAAVSGCAVPRLWGDQAMIEAALVCGPDADARRGVPQAHDCRVVPTRRRWTKVACQPRAGPSAFSMKTEVAASG